MKGVTIKNGKYLARVRLNNKTVYSESFLTKEEAQEAYLKAKAELSPKIQPAPFAGNIPVEKIQRAVDSVSNA